MIHLVFNFYNEVIKIGQLGSSALNDTFLDILVKSFFFQVHKLFRFLV